MQTINVFTLTTKKHQNKKCFYVKIHAKNSAGQNQELADASNLIEVANGIWQADFKAGVFRTVTFYCRGKAGDSFGKIGLFSKKIIDRNNINDICKEQTAYAQHLAVSCGAAEKSAENVASALV